MKSKKEILGKNLSELVYKSGHSQVEISKYIGVNPKSFSTYVTGRCMPDYDILAKIAEYFYVTPSELLEDADVEQKPDQAFVNLFSQLNDNDKRSILYQIKGLLLKDEYAKKESSKLA